MEKINIEEIFASNVFTLAVMENYQQKNGTIEIPAVLIPYFGKDRIDARK